ncbi:MAG: UDP-N-acetylmuramoyl-tripeptide--D-alanyl-D-alanine ligase [Bdellovibrionota bacterium]
MMHTLGTIFLLAGILAFSWKRLLRYLQPFQQEEYDNQRYLRWLKENRVVDRRGLLATAVGAGLELLTGSYFVGALFAAALLGAIAHFEEDPRTTGKITLKLTARAKRIYWLAFGLLAAVFFVTLCFFHPSDTLLFWMSIALWLQLVPGALMLAKLILQPDEARRQAHFLNEAKQRLKEINPYVIGITGSFGKTTTKAFLGKLLDLSVGPTFWPPKSVNTPMGITRELRENLKPTHKYAVIEMGAYQRGSITRLCNLTPPKAAIVTAVGLMHLERFGSQENIYTAKSELARALPKDGILVCNGDNPGSRRIAEEFPTQTTLLYGLDPNAGKLDALLDSVKTTADGTAFSIHWRGQTFPGFTKLHGLPALSNILASFTMCCALGGSPELLVAAIRNLEPFDNRLEVRRVGASLQINDAYNSNPDGFRAALDVLRDLPGNRRILMTPGMVELGPLQAAENERLAKLAAEVCDVVIVVGETNREALSAGLRAGGLSSEKIVVVADRAQAFQKLEALRSQGDIVLIENDLPDLFEMNLRF